MSEKILVIDDEQDIADLLEVYLKNENYTVYKFYCAKDAMPYIENGDIDLAILDVMLPDMNGFSLCQFIRKKYTYPIIMLTHRTNTDFEYSVRNGLLKNIVPNAILYNQSAKHQLGAVADHSGRSRFALSIGNSQLYAVPVCKVQRYIDGFADLYCGSFYAAFCLCSDGRCDVALHHTSICRNWHAKQLSLSACKF